MITAYNLHSDSVLELPCPKCGMKADVSVARFIMAINRQYKWHCKECGVYFIVKIELLDLQTNQVTK